MMHPSWVTVEFPHDWFPWASYSHRSGSCPQSHDLSPWPDRKWALSVAIDTKGSNSFEVTAVTDHFGLLGLTHFWPNQNLEQSGNGMWVYRVYMGI